MATFTVTEHDFVTGEVTFAGQGTNVVDALAECVPHILRQDPFAFESMAVALANHAQTRYAQTPYLLTVTQP
jgi:hypothetical protein